MVMTTVMTRPVSSWRRMSVHSQGGEDEVDELDPDEGGDDPAHGVDQQVPAQDGGGADGPELDSFEGERDEQHDDDGVEDDGAEDGRVRVVEVHDVQRLELRDHPLEHGRDDGEVL